MLKRGFLAFLLVVSMPSLQAGELDINFSNDTGKLEYSTPVRNETFRQSQLTTGILFNNDSDYTLEAGLHVSGKVGSDAPGVSAGVGVDLVFGSARNATVSAVPLALNAALQPDFLPRLRLEAAFRFSPDILAFSDISQYRESSVIFGYEMLPETLIYLGGRHLTVDLEKGGRATIDNGLNIGVRFAF